MGSICRTLLSEHPLRLNLVTSAGMGRFRIPADFLGTGLPLRNLGIVARGLLRRRDEQHARWVIRIR
jgi:hypothetical protein